MLAAPMADSSADEMLDEAICLATLQGLVQPGQYAVCILSQRGELVLKVAQVGRHAPAPC
jgi:hypothetical protein